EWFQHSMVHHFGTSLREATSPSSDWTYKLVSPMLFNLGIAYTFSNVALVSVDYERANYNLMRFKAVNFSDNNFFDSANTDIQGQYAPGASNRIRVGMEVKPLQSLAIRAGYNLDKTGKGDNAEKFHRISLGFGYISAGSFFCDIAAKVTLQPQKIMKVYGDLEADDGMTVIPGPTTISDRKLLNIVGTLGWRF
ncbi:MAG: hypothetical protein KBS53_04070, partial [Bacteroidales bacterium]|nr:hypothetical protein [Candidatus Hennigimonas equi]